MTLTNTVFKAKLSPPVHRIGFQKAFENLPYKEMRPVKMALMDQLGWAISTFQYKKRGDTPIRENEIQVIEDIFAAFGIDAWTGKKL